MDAAGRDPSMTLVRPGFRSRPFAGSRDCGGAIFAAAPFRSRRLLEPDRPPCPPGPPGHAQSDITPDCDYHTHRRRTPLVAMLLPEAG